MHATSHSWLNVIRTHILPLISTSTGVVFLYMALFMYKNDFGKVENFLVNLWVQVDDLARGAPNKLAALIKVLAAAVSSAFDRLFGSNVKSLRAVAVSAALSLLPVYIARAIKHFDDRLLAPQLILAVLFLIVPLIFLWFSKAAYGAEALVLFLLTTDLILLLFLAAQEHIFVILAAGLCFAVLSDFGLIALNRWGLKWCSRENSIVKIASLLVVNIILAIVSCLLPWMAAHYYDRQYLEAVSDPSKQTLSFYIASKRIETTGVTSFKEIEEDFTGIASEIQDDLEKDSLGNRYYYDSEFEALLYRITPFIRLCDATENEDYQRFYAAEEQNTLASLHTDSLTATDGLKAQYRDRAEKKVAARRILRAESCDTKTAPKLAYTVPFIQNAIADFRKGIVDVANRKSRLEDSPVLAENARLFVLTNVDTLGMSILLIGSMTGMMVHRFFWPLLARPLHALADLGFLKSRTLLGLTGSSLLGVTPFWEKILAPLVRG